MVYEKYASAHFTIKLLCQFLVQEKVTITILTMIQTVAANKTAQMRYLMLQKDK